MKKPIAVFAVLLFVAPAFAADWSFYGSERIATWYKNQDFGNSKYQTNGSSSDAGTQWYLQDNSRFGAKVKADKVTGLVELGLNATSGNGGDMLRGSNGGDGAVTTRRAYGQWMFSDIGYLKVGKDYSPTSSLISNQFFDSDKSMYGMGNFYGRRPAGLTLGLGDFQIAFLAPQQGFTGGIGSTTTGILAPVTNRTTMAQTNVTGDPDVYMPKIEAAYTLKFGTGSIKPFGGFQYYQVKSFAGSGVQDDIDIYSWVLGVSTTWNIGAFSITGQVNYGANQAISSWDTGVNSGNVASPILKTGGDDVADVYTLQAAIVPALNLTDTLRFETGFGYRQDNANGAPGYSQNDGAWVTYLQALIKLAPGVYLCPEVGYYDYMDDRAGDNQGYTWYAGAKWQIDL